MLQPRQKAFIYFFFYSMFLLLLRSFLINSTLSYDEAEQIVFSQTLSAGYPAQPPLYNWLQWLSFKTFAVNLFSLSLVKFSLICAVLYVYHLICRAYFPNSLLAWGATLSWALIPNISYDFLPHRTHVILALLVSAGTWYWFIKAPPKRLLTWYVGLGILIGMGILAKFNYLLFLCVLLTAGLTIEEYRRRIFTTYILISLIIAVLLSSPYWLWLLQHRELGLHASYKLVIAGKGHFYGLLRLFEASLCFIGPLLAIKLFFPLSWQNASPTPEKQLLWRYHILLLPFLMVLVLFSGMNNVRTHWLVPLYFLYPLCLFSLIRIEKCSITVVKKYLFLCLAVQLAIISSWMIRVPKLADFPLKTVVQDIKSRPVNPTVIVSDSHWLLGSLMLNLAVKEGILINFEPHVHLSGPVLAAWEGTTKSPWWLAGLNPGERDDKIVTRIHKNSAISRLSWLAEP
ncbi:glycosyl transferase [Legionella jordanis]|uniref:Glycosyl transferase n=3 Tax=Legionella jordanis TaxID=456 RepID=A0A0W0VA33_9GAMM|nr:glycosyltransferase family 39 protein [Legionella jordanis]KTD16726.1 glycosyl transferase [Legionella jordanis]VEH11805.1 glycosyl transferase [Legionella jordanis]